MTQKSVSGCENNPSVIFLVMCQQKWTIPGANFKHREHVY